MPQKTADVTVELYDNRRQVKTRMTHTVNPADILIRHTGYEHVTPYETLQQPADTAHAIRIAYIAEGYQAARSEEHTSELQSRQYLVCRLLLEKKKKNTRLPRRHTT